MKIQSKTIILLLLLIVSLISLLSYFFFTKYKFLLDYIDNRIDLKNNKLIEKYSLNLNDDNKEKEHNYFNNLKDNLENFNNTLSHTNFIDQISSLSDIEEDIDEDNDEDNEGDNDEDLYSNSDENKDEQYNKESDEPILDIEEIETSDDFDLQELPNLDNIEDNVDNYIKEILENKDLGNDISNLEFTEELEKKK